MTLAQVPEPTHLVTTLILIGAALCGHGAANLELLYRKRQDRILMRLTKANWRSQLSKFSPDALVLRAVTEQWVIGWLLFVGFAQLLRVGVLLTSHLPLPHTPLVWPALLAPALVGGVLSLRTRRAIATAAATLMALAFLHLAGP